MPGCHENPYRQTDLPDSGRLNGYGFRMEEMRNLKDRRKSDSRVRVILPVVIILAAILFIAGIMEFRNRRSAHEEASSGNPPESWTWTPVPDEQLAEIGVTDPDQKIADLSAYGIDNHHVLAMSQRALVEYLSRDNDFNGVIMIADPQDAGCKKVMQVYVDAAENNQKVNFYYVDLQSENYKEAIRTVLASTLPRDDSGKPVMKTPLVLAVNGDQVVDYEEGTTQDSSEEALCKRYGKLAQESAENR